MVFDGQMSGAEAAALWSGLLLLLLVVLSMRVALTRRSRRVSLGDGGDPDLALKSRVFGNAAEWMRGSSEPGGPCDDLLRSERQVSTDVNSEWRQPAAQIASRFNRLDKGDSWGDQPPASWQVSSIAGDGGTKYNKGFRCAFPPLP